jgi:hypothetical protein
MLLSTCVALAVGACHDTSPASATRSLAPSEAPARAAGLAAGDADWDTYSAVVTIHQEGVQFKSPTTDDASFRVTRVLQADSSWHTTVAPRGRGAAGRIEIDDSGIRSYDGAGKEIVRDGPDVASLAAAARAKHPGQPPFPLPARGNGGGAAADHRGGGARDWADAFLAAPAAGARARGRYAVMFGAPERVGAQDRYTRREGGRTLELLVDSLTGVAMDVKQAQDGVLAFHVTNAYDRLPNGSALLRETRVEHPSPTGAGAAITITRYDSVTFGRGGSVR